MATSVDLYADNLPNTHPKEGEVWELSAATSKNMQSEVAKIFKGYDKFDNIPEKIDGEDAVEQLTEQA